MTDERKQEQQRKIAEALLRAQWHRGEVAHRRVDGSIEFIIKMPPVVDYFEIRTEVIDALNGPYGRFFNEGTD
jgi:hypothetical protein